MKTAEEIIIEKVGKFWWVCGKHKPEFIEAMKEYASQFKVQANALNTSTKRENLFCEGCVNLTNDPCKKYEKADNKSCSHYKAK